MHVASAMVWSPVTSLFTLQSRDILVLSSFIILLQGVSVNIPIYNWTHICKAVNLKGEFGLWLVFQNGWGSSSANGTKMSPSPPSVCLVCPLNCLLIQRVWLIVLPEAASFGFWFGFILFCWDRVSLCSLGWLGTPHPLSPSWLQAWATTPGLISGSAEVKKHYLLFRICFLELGRELSYERSLLVF